MLDLCAEKNNRTSRMRYKEALEGPFCTQTKITWSAKARRLQCLVEPYTVGTYAELTQSVPLELLPMRDLCRFRGGSVLIQLVGQFGAGVNNQAVMARFVATICSCVN